MKNKNLYLLSIITILPFLLIVSFGLGEYQNNKWYIDNKIWDHILEIRNPSVTKIITFITHAGDSIFLTSLVIIVVLILKTLKKEFKFALWFAISTLLGAYFLNRFLKYVFTRPRPYLSGYIDNLVLVRGYSFPSGHAMGSVVVYVLLAYILIRYIKNKNIKLCILATSIIFSLIICFTRIYLGVHYPTDVIAGFSLGLTWAILSILYIKGDN